jgi:hypothetical protein
MRRIENMKTLNVRRAAPAPTRIDRVPAVRPANRPESAVAVGAAIEQQIDEIQGTFGVRWEW